VTQPRTVVGGRYEIVRKIAEGGMGSVHEAVHLLSKRTVALKLLAPEVAKDETKRQRFLREVSAPAQIGHDGIVEIFDAGYDEKLGLLFVAMELLLGETLRERIVRLNPKRDPSARETLLDLYDHMLEPIAAAHARGIVHRDLKPENVFVHRKRDGSEIVKVLDFGIARELDTSIPSVTQTGIAMGTPHYMSPEQAMNARDASFPADVWSLGAMLYEIVSGDTPFPGETAGSIIAAAVTQAHRPLVSVAPSTSPALGELVDRCLAKRPEDRPRDAQALLDALRQARGRAAPPMSSASQTPAPGTSPVPSYASPPTGPMTGPLGALHSPAPVTPPTQIAVGHTTGPAVSLAAPTPAGGPSSAPAMAVATAQAGSSRTWLWVALGSVFALFGGGTCCLGGVVALGLLGESGGDDASLDDAPLQWDGELTAGDRTEGQFYFDTFALEARANDTMTIELTSPDFDTKLRVGTPSGGSYENDDFPGMDLNSRIDIRSTEAGSYTVHVTSYSPMATGAYVVSVRH